MTAIAELYKRLADGRKLSTDERRRLGTRIDNLYQSGALRADEYRRLNHDLREHR